MYQLTFLKDQQPHQKSYEGEATVNFFQEETSLL